MATKLPQEQSRWHCSLVVLLAATGMSAVGWFLDPDTAVTKLADLTRYTATQFVGYDATSGELLLSRAEATELLMHHITPHLPTAKIRIHDDGGEAGLVAVAAEDLAAGEVFLEIPAELALCESVVTDTFGESVAKSLRSGGLNTSGDLLLPLALLVEHARGIQSKWSEYIEALPQFPVPLHQADTQEVANVLQGLDVQRAVESMLDLTRQTALALFESAQTLQNASYVPYFTPSLPEAQWAVGIAKSRGFNMMVQKCLLPVADYFSHADEAPVERTQSSFRLTKEVPKNQELFYNYGHHFLMEFQLVAYGFTSTSAVPAFGADMFFVLKKEEEEAPVTPDGTLYEQRLAVFAAVGCMDIFATLMLAGEETYEDIFQEVILPCARIIKMPKKALPHAASLLRKGVEKKRIKGVMRPTSPNHERRTLHLLRSLHEEKVDGHARWTRNETAMLMLKEADPEKIGVLKSVREAEIAFHLREVQRIGTLLQKVPQS